MIHCFRTLQQQPNGTVTLTEYDFLAPLKLICFDRAWRPSRTAISLCSYPLSNGLGMQFTKSVPWRSGILAKAGTYDPLLDPIASPGIIFASKPVPRVLFPIRRSGFPAGAYPTR